MTPRSRVAVLLAAAFLILPISCSSDDTASQPLDQVAPTKADVAREAGISFPASTAGFRLVRIAAGQVDLTFTVDLADVDRFAKGSGIELEDGKRVIMHASPVWDVAVTGEVRGGSSTKGTIRRDAEVVVENGVATVRLSLVRT
ncbi:MAG: hypothetical protein U0Q22_02010 [Acidimicrobiales bacterium]